MSSNKYVEKSLSEFFETRSFDDYSPLVQDSYRQRMTKVVAAIDPDIRADERERVLKALNYVLREAGWTVAQSIAIESDTRARLTQAQLSPVAAEPKVFETSEQVLGCTHADSGGLACGKCFVESAQRAAERLKQPPVAAEPRSMPDPHEFVPYAQPGVCQVCGREKHDREYHNQPTLPTDGTHGQPNYAPGEPMADPTKNYGICSLCGVSVRNNNQPTHTTFHKRIAALEGSKG